MSRLFSKVRSLFQWYHREEWQVVAILVGLIIFFSRTVWISIGVTAFVVATVLVLYCLRLLEFYCSTRGLCLSLVNRYRAMKQALHVHSVERSRMAMALLASFVLLILTIYRIDLALAYADAATPTDIYWIVFLGWYTLECTITSAYLIWLWRNWVRQQSVRIPIMDGLVASLFFYHGLESKERLVTTIAAFLLGGVPSYFALRLSTDIPYAYTIAVLLIIPVIIFNLGGAYYAKHYLQKRQNTVTLAEEVSGVR